MVIVSKRGKEQGEQGGPEEETAVWLLASMFDATLGRSCVGILDGQDVSRGPIARAWLDHPLPHSLHGSFTTEVFQALS